MKEFVDKSWKGKSDENRQVLHREKEIKKKSNNS